MKLLERATPAIAEAGVTLRSVDIRDIMLPGDLKRVFAQEVAARKEGARRGKGVADGPDESG